MVRYLKNIFFLNEEQYHGLQWDKDGGRETAKDVTGLHPHSGGQTKGLGTELEGKTCEKDGATVQNWVTGRSREQGRDADYSSVDLKKCSTWGAN